MYGIDRKDLPLAHVQNIHWSYPPEVDYADARYNRGVANNSAGNTTGCTEDFNQVEKLKPHFPDNYITAGLLIMHLVQDAGYDRLLKGNWVVTRFWKAYSEPRKCETHLNDIPGCLCRFIRKQLNWIRNMMMPSPTGALLLADWANMPSYQAFWQCQKVNPIDIIMHVPSGSWQKSNSE